MISLLELPGVWAKQLQDLVAPSAAYACRKACRGPFAAALLALADVA